VKLWGQSNVEGGNLIAQAQVDGVVSPLVARVEGNGSTLERPKGAFGVLLRDVGAWEDVLVGSLTKGIATPFWEVDGEVSEGSSGEKWECDEGLHFDVEVSTCIESASR